MLRCVCYPLKFGFSLLSKHPKPGIRPICISDTWRRLVAKGLHKVCSKHLQQYFQHAHPRAIQFGGNTHNGATNMFHLLASCARSVQIADEVQQDPVVLIALDITNAFNSLSRQSLLDFLAAGCETHVSLGPEPERDLNHPIGWDILWRHIKAHYGTSGILKHYQAGSVEYISSQAGVQQGDPLGSTLFAMAIHPTLISIAERHPDVLLTAYADNVIIVGPLSKATNAVDMYQDRMAAMGLKLNSAESEAYIPAWSHTPLDRIQHNNIKLQEPHEQTTQVVTAAGLVIPWCTQGIKVVGCPLGTRQFCESTMLKTAEKIEQDINLLLRFPNKHQRIKLATYCVNSRASYFLRAADLEVSLPIMKDLDLSFDRFWAQTLNFEPEWATSSYHREYANAVKQLRLGVRQGGCGFTSNELIAPAALYAGLSEFTSWCKDHLEITYLPWLQPHVQQHRYLWFQHVEENLQIALTQMENTWGIPSAECPEAESDESDSDKNKSDIALFTLPSVSGLAGDQWPDSRRPKQHQISTILKRLSCKRFQEGLSASDLHRVKSVARYTVPARDKLSYIAPAIDDCKDTLPQCAMCLFALTSCYELSNNAIDTTLAIQTGAPIPHVRFLREHVQGFTDMDPFGDKALNDSVHASNTRKSSHNRIAQELANITSEAGIPTTADEKQVPFTYDESDGPARPDQPKRRRGDVFTNTGGLLRSTPSQPWISNNTKVILDVKLGHTYSSATAAHPQKLKERNLAEMESLKRSKYQSPYRDKELAFAGAVCNTWGECGPELLRFLWAVAEFSARNQTGTSSLYVEPSLALPAAASSVQEHQENAFKKLRGSLFHQFRQRILCTILEGVTERMFGRTFALSANKHYRRWQHTAKELWQPVLCNLPDLVSPVATGLPSPPLASSYASVVAA